MPKSEKNENQQVAMIIKQALKQSNYKYSELKPGKFFYLDFQDDENLWQVQISREIGRASCRERV